MTGSNPTLLVVDDEPAMRQLLRQFGARCGFEVVAHEDGAQTLAALSSMTADVAVVDVRMPCVGGLEVLKALRRADSACRVILMSGDHSIDTAIAAVKLGALDYLTKPLDLPRLGTLLACVQDEIRRAAAVLDAEGAIAREAQCCGMIGRSAPMQELFALIRRVGPHARTALITGETGVGKELVASALHQAHPQHRQFVAVNCSALVESLVESELFGHVRGAFTGATETKQGLFEAAHGGTLFLDEIGELPLAAQAKLLRVIDSGEIQRVGSPDRRHVSVRVLAATNRSLVAEAAAERFRADLYYRLNVLEIVVPPLRERREDIPYLTASFLVECSRRLRKPLAGITPAGERLLLESPWPGNVRQLRNTIERACLLSDSRYLTERDLLPALRDSIAPLPDTPGSDRIGPVCTLADLEWAHVTRTLAETAGNKAEAARRLGVSRRALYRRLEKGRSPGTSAGAAGGGETPPSRGRA